MWTEQLERIVPPPECPIAATGDWTSAEATIGATLPRDYQSLITRYGTGGFDGFLWILSPFAENRYMNLISIGRQWIDAMDNAQRGWLPVPNLKLFPERDGMYPWATTDNGDVLCWLFDGTGFCNRIVVWAARETEWEVFESATVNFLTDLLTGRIKSQAFPDDFPHMDGHTFTPVVPPENDFRKTKGK